MFRVSYKNNLDRVPATTVEGSMTPAQFIQENGVSLGNYALQLNGITLSGSEQNQSFDAIAAKYSIAPDTELMLAGVKPSNGGSK